MRISLCRSGIAAEIVLAQSGFQVFNVDPTIDKKNACVCANISVKEEGVSDAR